jgi:hypothetical protein
LNPTQWFKFVFEISGGDKHPTASFIVTVVAFALIGGLVWRAGSLQYKKEKSSVVETPAPTITIDQDSIDSNCSNVVAGKDVKIDCKPGQENDSAKDRPKVH